VIGYVTRSDPVTGARAINVTRAIDVVRTCILVAVIVTVCLGRPAPGFASARGVAIVVTLALSALAWIVWMLAGQEASRISVGSLIVMGAAGGVLAGLSPNSPALAVGCAATFSAGVRLKTEVSLGITAETLAGFLIAGLIAGTQDGALFGYPFAFLGLWSVSLTRREYLTRAEQAERTLAETRRAREAENQAATLAERARIARDIHDVLSHSLAAVSVNLQAAEGLLTADSLPADNLELAKAIECIERAGTLTREGMTAARRAVMALREDAGPLADQLSALVSQYRMAGDMDVSFTVTGTVRPLSEQASLTAYRTAQEGLTNARKHASGQPVALSLGFEPGVITVSVANPLPPAGESAGSLAATGGGYGLTGLRERAALAGGSLEAGPVAGTWQLCLKMPA
jgi:signal transduction histidine kinase